jgi:long-subunit acyl-CoA synthetase (AMP-forming)
MRRSPLDSFFENANRLQQRTALRQKASGAWRETSWSDYARDVRRAARGLMHLGVTAGGRIAIVGPNRPEWVIGALGAMAAGAAPAGIYTTSTPDQMAYIAAHAEAPVVIVHDHKQLAKFRAQKAQLPLVKHYVLMSGEPQAADELTFAQLLALADKVPEAELDTRLKAIKPDDVATLIYTSGTTGTPKAVMITHGNVAFAGEANVQFIRATAEDHLLSYLPLSHIAEQALTVFGPATAGYSVSFCDSLEQLGEYLRDVRPTLFFGVPRVWEKMQAKMIEAGKQNSGLKKKIAAWARGVGLRNGYARQNGGGAPAFYGLANKLVFSKVRERLGFDRLRFAACGAAPVAKSTLEFFLSLDLPIYEVYGMSEVTGAATLSSPGMHRTGTVGKVVPGTELKIAEDGEILMRGPLVCKGYLKDEAATREAIDADGWLHSGDVGEFDAEGFLRITDRKKDLFKTAGGKYIAPQTLEALLKGIPGVGQAVVVGEGKKFAVALLTLDPEACATLGKSAAELAADGATVSRLQEAVQQVNAGLAPYETIKKIKVLPTEFTVESGELTPTLKLKRKVVSQRYAKEIEALYGD